MTDKPIFATRDFTDAGTERSFAGGKPIEGVEPKVMDNYRAAGLASDEQPAGDVAAASITTAAPGAPKRSARRRSS